MRTISRVWPPSSSSKAIMPAPLVFENPRVPPRPPPPGVLTPSPLVLRGRYAIRVYLRDDLKGVVSNKCNSYETLVESGASYYRCLSLLISFVTITDEVTLRTSFSAFSFYKLVIGECSPLCI